jgi:hypothetical protein
MQKQRWVFVAAALASFLVDLDALVSTTTLPTIRRHLGASLKELEWTLLAGAVAPR